MYFIRTQGPYHVQSSNSHVFMNSTLVFYINIKVTLYDKALVLMMVMVQIKYYTTNLLLILV